MNFCRPKLNTPITLAFLASLTYLFQSVAWQFSKGRDYETYIIYYLDFFLDKPSLHTLMVYRTPVSPFILGSLLEYGGATATEIFMGLCFVGTVSLTYAIGANYSKGIGILAATSLMLFPHFGAIYHTATGDPIFATLLMSWAFYICQTERSPTLKKYFFHGLFVAVLILTRPIAQVFLLFAISPFLMDCQPFRRKAQFATAFLFASISVGLAWSLHNHIRYDDFSISRGTQAIIPFQRSFVRDKIVHPDNGKYSTEFIQVVETQLLTREPYRSYGIDRNQFLTAGSSRIFLDLWDMSDRHWGWDSDYEVLFKVGVEAVASNPARFAYGVTKDFLVLLVGKYQHHPPALPSNVQRQSRNSDSTNIAVSASRLKTSLPIPSEGHPIPGPNSMWVASNPDNSVIRDWSDINAPKTVFLDSELERNSQITAARMSNMPSLPTRAGNLYFSKFLNGVTRYIYPSIIVWVVLAVLGLFVRPTKRKLSKSLIFLMSLGAVFITAIATNANTSYSIPFLPVFFLFGTVGLFRVFEKYFRDYFSSPSL